MSRRLRTNGELQNISRDLYYEISMLHSMANLLETRELGNGPLANAALESFTLHVRVLMEFLYAEKPRDDDVIAEDFISDSVEWEKMRPPLTKNLKIAQYRVGKHVAHLTYNRLQVTSETRLWPYLEIYKDISEAIAVFQKYAPREKLDDKWNPPIS